MSDTTIEAASPLSRDSILSIIGSLEGRPRAAKGPEPLAPEPPQRPQSPQPAEPPQAPPSQHLAPQHLAPQQLAPQQLAAQPFQGSGIDDLRAALCDMTADRDAWRDQAIALRAELARHLEAASAERQASDAQTSQLIDTIATLGKGFHAKSDAGREAQSPRPRLAREPIAATAPFTDGPAPMAIPALAPDTHREPAPGTRIGVSKVKALARPHPEASATAPAPSV